MPTLWRSNPTHENEDLRSLEEELRATLRPVEANEAFIQRVEEWLMNPRTLSVYQARSWAQSWVLLGSIAGTMLALGVLGVWLWLKKR